MPTEKNLSYDCIIIGGGLAGLCLAIQLAQKKHSILLVEKNTYPFHKVCGEYVSMESWNFIESLGLNLSNLNLPKITKLHISAQNGYTISSNLNLGGFGISRYSLDFELAKLAKASGVVLLENCKATAVSLKESTYHVQTTSGIFHSKLVCGSYGKISPAFIKKEKENSKGTYIAVKYHLKTQLATDTIELHNFKDGYCGISKIDGDNYCLCYLTSTKNLHNNNNDIKLLEKNILMQNPLLKKYFTQSEFLFEKPLTISQISFDKKSTYLYDILLLGDSAGAIAPLCGNGMSIAMRSSKFLATHISLFLKHTISKQELIENYTKEWNANFSLRIKTAYYLQQLFGKEFTTLMSLKLLNTFPSFFRKIISLTHGKPF